MATGTVNKVILIGHLGDAVKMYYFEGGNAIGRFPLATNESYTNRQTGEKITNTDWHNIVVRNKLAELCEKYLTKGDKVYLEGKIRNRQYEIEGQKRYTTEIYVDEMTFLSYRKDNQNQTNQNSSVSPSQNMGSDIGTTNQDDDLPF